MERGDPEVFKAKIQSVFFNVETRSMMVEGETNWILVDLRDFTYTIHDRPPEVYGGMTGMRLNLSRSEDRQPPTEPTSEEAEQVETAAQKTTTLTGKIKGNIREGRNDSSGKPTVWARLAVHEEDNEQARMLSTTFHRATVPIARGLKPEDQITVQGYYRKAQDPSRMDGLSVFHLVNYPGKPRPNE